MGFFSLQIFFWVYLSVRHSHTVHMKECPCRIYRQLNLILMPSGHMPKSFAIIFNGSVIKDGQYLQAIWKLENQCCVFSSFKLNTVSFISIYFNICMPIYSNTFSSGNYLIGNESVTLKVHYLGSRY